MVQVAAFEEIMHAKVAHGLKTLDLSKKQPISVAQRDSLNISTNVCKGFLITRN